MSWLSSMLGCRHKRVTWPQSKRNGEPHVTCVDCGKEFTYDWDRMQITKPTARPFDWEALKELR